MNRFKTKYLIDLFQRLDIAEEMISELEDRIKNFIQISVHRYEKVADRSRRKIQHVCLQGRSLKTS